MTGPPSPAALFLKKKIQLDEENKRRRAGIVTGEVVEAGAVAGAKPGSEHVLHLVQASLEGTEHSVAALARC